MRILSHSIIYSQSQYVDSPVCIPRKALNGINHIRTIGSGYIYTHTPNNKIERKIRFNPKMLI